MSVHVVPIQAINSETFKQKKKVWIIHLYHCTFSWLTSPKCNVSNMALKSEFNETDEAHVIHHTESIFES